MQIYTLHCQQKKIGDKGKFMTFALYVLWYAKKNLVTSSCEIIALTAIELRLSKGINKSSQ